MDPLVRLTIRLKLEQMITTSLTALFETKVFPVSVDTSQLPLDFTLQNFMVAYWAKHFLELSSWTT